MKFVTAVLSHFYRQRFWYGALLIFLTAFWFRNQIAERDLTRLRAATGCEFAPQLVESAIMYGYIDRIAGNEWCGGTDPKLANMQHRKVSEQMSLSLEYVYGGLLRLRRMCCGTPVPGDYETSAAENAFLQKVLTAQLALVPVLVFLWLGILRVPWIWAVLGALVETFSLAAVAKYTGQDLLKGAFAFPLVTLFLTLAVYSCRKYSPARCIAAAIAAFLAVACWDESQIIICAWALWELLRRLFGGVSSRKRFNLWIGIWWALLAAAVFVPYHRAHGLFFSPVMQWILPAAIAVNFPWRDRTPGIRFSGVFEVLSMTGLCWYWWKLVSLWSDFGINYDHFSALLSAKIKFLNCKPADPLLLNFDQRFLWTPELHSATWRIIRLSFPAALVTFLCLAAGILLLLAIRHKKLHFALPYRTELYRILFYTLGFFAAFCLFVRLRDFTALFTALGFALAGALWQRQFLGGFNNTRKKRRWSYQLLVVLVLALATGAVAAEYRNTCRVQRAYPNNLQPMAKLIRYLRSCDLEHSVILSDMQISPLLFGYVRSGIVVQPKYELPEVRRTTQTFLETFFNGTIRDFEDFCCANHVDWLVIHLPMVLTTPAERNSYRYMTATRELHSGTPARELLRHPLRLNAFAEVAFPPEYRELHRNFRLFRFVGPVQRAQAEHLREKALQAHYLKAPRQAEQLIREARQMDPASLAIQCSYVDICNTVPPALRLPAKP